MSRRLGFRVDVRGCTGCKACQVACQDKHDLDPDVRWRRVAEVAGGGWQQEGSAWRDASRTWFVTVACMHCEDPICVEVCPTRAMGTGEHGIVAIEPERCMGCHYCAWACPYGAPQYDTKQGVMTKCDLCRDRLAEGRAPACVAACPTRVLGVEDAAQPSGGVDALFPLPDPDLTQPVCALTPHREAGGCAASALRIGNAEEIEPHTRPGTAEGSLVLFTVFAQAAAGLCVVSACLGLLAPAAVAPAGGVFGAAFVLLVLGGLAAATHLGRPRAAPLALANLRSSWLSREVLAFSALAGVVFVGLILSQLDLPSRPLTWAAALLGVLLLIAIASVYRLRTVPAWNTWLTPVTFCATAAVLGCAGLALLLATQAEAGAARRVLGVTAALLAILQLLLLGVHLRRLAREGGAAAESADAVLVGHRPMLIRRGLYALAGAGVVLGITWPERAAADWMALGLGCVLLLASELFGRVLFYASHRRTGL